MIRDFVHFVGGNCVCRFLHLMMLLFSVGVNVCFGLADTITLTTTNTVTGQPTTMVLQRYNLRAPGFQVRIYTNATQFGLLSSNSIPEVSTYRGRIPNDPEAMVVGSFASDGSFYFTVTYGCRDTLTDFRDPWDGTNRIRWGGWFGGWGTANPNPQNQFPGAFVNPGDGRVAYNIATTNIPAHGYIWTSSTNTPQPIGWTAANYPPLDSGYGGPTLINNVRTVPVQRVRLIMDIDQEAFLNACQSNISFAILMQEARLNDVDYQQARDFGICYELAAICVWPNGGRGGDLGSVTGFWNADPGKGNWFDMVTSTHYQYSGVAWISGDYSVIDPFYCGAVMGHEMSHIWGANHDVSPVDYTGENPQITSMTRSAYAHGIAEVTAARDLRRNWRTWFQWVKYNSPVAPFAAPDFALTEVNQPVSIDVLLNDYIASSNVLSVVAFETNTAAGGAVSQIAPGVLRYQPLVNFTGYDLFRYYVAEPSGLKSLSAAKVLVKNSADPLLARWPLDQTNGTNALESSGRGTTGILEGSGSFSGSGSVQGLGFGKRALHLDGNGYIRLKGTWGDPLNGSMSVSLWCRPDAPQKGNQSLFNKCNESGWRIGLNQTSFYCGGFPYGGINWFHCAADVFPQSNTWYHVVGVLDREAQLVRLYVNGKQFNGSAIPSGEFIAGEIWPSLGKGVARVNDGNYVGAIADVQMYAKALSASEVQTLYVDAGTLPTGGPSPADHQRDVELSPFCTWLPASGVFDVYFGTNFSAVQTASTASLEYQGRLTQAAFSPAGLEPDTSYYWRVDAIDPAQNVIPGSVWRFRTARSQAEAGLKVYMTLDQRDIVGTQTFDRAGPPFSDGTLINSPSSVSGQIHEALLFNGANNYVEIAAPNLQLTSATFLAWVNRLNSIPAYAGILITRSGNRGVGLNVGPSNDLRFLWNDDGVDWSWPSGLGLSPGQWTLAAVVVTPTNATIYRGSLNGSLSSATLIVSNLPVTLSSNLRIGNDPLELARTFSGSIDEGCLWDRALTRAEIGNLLTNGINRLSISGSRPVPQPGTFTWTGAAGNQWLQSGNWTANAVPSVGDTVLFNDSASSNLNTQLGGNQSVAGVRFGGALRRVEIGGSSTLTVGSGGIGITNSPGNEVRISAPMQINVSQTWNVDEDAELWVSGSPSGPANITKSGAGTATVEATSYHTGGTIVQAGTLVLADNGNWWGSGFYNSQSITVNPGGRVVVRGWNGLQGNGAALPKPVIVNRGAVLTCADGFGAHLRGPLTLAGGTLASGTPDLYWGTWGFQNNITVSGGTNTSFLSAERMGGAMNIHVNPGAISGVDAELSGTLTDFGSGITSSLTKSGAGTLRISCDQTYSGATTINAGEFRVDQTLANGNAVSIQSGAWLSGTGLVLRPTILAHNSGLRLKPGTPLNLGSITLNGTVNVSVLNGQALHSPNIYPLLNFVSRSGAGQFSLQSVPGLTPGAIATLHCTSKQVLLLVHTTDLPQLLNMKFQGDQLHGTFFSPPQVTFHVQRATNLNAPVIWSTLLTNAADLNGLLQFTDAFDDLAAPPQNGFYRLTTP